MVTMLKEKGQVDIPRADARGSDLWVPSDEVERVTGWHLKPEGMCHEEICVPAPPGHSDEFLSLDAVNITAFWRHMGRPVLLDAAGGNWILRESATERARTLEQLEAPDFRLPDLQGRLHSLSDYRGKKVFLTTWASW